MIKLLKFIYIISLFYLAGCSFDQKTGIWSGNEEERKKISELERGRAIIKVEVFSSKKDFDEEINSNTGVQLTSASEINISWPMSGLNLKNSTGNLIFSGELKRIFKKKIGKNKHSYAKVITAPIIAMDSILFTDNNGTIFNLNHSGKIKWKKNIYKKINKEYYKNLSHVFYEDIIFISDNIGYLYSIDKNNGDTIWMKYHGVPFKSHIKIFNDKILLIDQDNKILCFNIEDGSQIWSTKTNLSFIKSQGYLALAVSNEGHVFVINSSGDLYKINIENGEIIWSIPSTDNLMKYETNFFATSDIVIDKNAVIFSNIFSNTYSINLKTGLINWKNNIRSKITPIIIDDYVFILTNNGYAVNIDKISGKIIWSSNILKNFKKRKRKIKITGFVIGSGKVYVTTINGYLIVCSALSGKIESYKKIAKSIYLSPIISDNKLYILTGESKLIVFI